MKATERITTLILSVMTAVAGVLPAIATPLSVNAEAIKGFESTDINTDLSDINSLQYPKNPLGDLEVIRFTEYCYSEKAFFEQYYGLYLYVYNPTETEIAETGNVVNMAISYDVNGEPTDYEDLSLEYCSKTSNNRFLKYRVEKSADVLGIARLYEKEHGERRYDVVGIQLMTKSGDTLSDEVKAANDVKHEKTYYYTGYAKGCGEDETAESTLVCRYVYLETIGLETEFFNYRTGDYINNVCDELHTVYFSVPDKYFEKYGGLQRIKAEWYEYKTTPMFITSDSNAFDALYPYIGRDIGESASGFDWTVLWEMDTSELVWYMDKVYNKTGKLEGMTAMGDITVGSHVVNWKNAEYLSRMDYLFERSNASGRDDYNISASEVKEYMETYTKRFSTQEKVLDKYAKNLFSESIDTARQDLLTDKTATKGHVVQEIDAGESWSLTFEKKQSAWDKLWKGAKYEKKNIEPIVTLDSGISTMSARTFANTYFMNEEEEGARVLADCQEMLANNETPVLFRFATTEFYASSARYEYLGNTYVSEYDGYVAQETLFLNFDIISLSFRNTDNVDTVIGVVMDPMDIINGIDELPDHGGNGCNFDLLKWLEKAFKWIVNNPEKALVLLAVVALVILFLPDILRWIIKWGLKIVIYIITFKWLRDIIKLFKGDDKK